MNSPADDQQIETADRNAGAAGESVDAFHRGRFHLIQPKGRGHRAGLDAMLLAALVPTQTKGELADLGAGAGAAGFAVASRVKDIRIMLIERSEEMVQFARQSIALDQNAHLAPRLCVNQADVTLKGKARIAAGLSDSRFDHVIMNPPFNDQSDRTTPDTLRAEAHAMCDHMFADWIRTACAIARPAGQLSLIARPQSLTRIIEACDNRFGGLQVHLVHPKENEDAIRVLLTGIKGNRARIAFRPPVFVHGADHREFSPMVDDLVNGRACLSRQKNMI